MLKIHLTFKLFFFHKPAQCSHLLMSVDGVPEIQQFGERKPRYNNMRAYEGLLAQ